MTKMGVKSSRISIGLTNANWLVILICFSAVLTYRANAQELAWKLSAGDRFDVVLSQQKVTNTQVDNRDVKIESSTIINQDWEVASVDEKGNYRIKQTIQSIKLNVGNPQFPNQALAVDTSSESKLVKESAKVLKQVQALIGLEFFVTMSPRGEIRAVTYSEDTKKVLQELPGSLDLQSLFTDRGVKDLLGAAAIVFPAKSPEQGESWQVDDSIVNPFGEFQRLRKYQFAAVEKLNDYQIAVIELTTSIEPKKLADKKSGKLNSFEETGELRVNLSNGIVSSCKTHSVTDAETMYREIAVKTMVESTNSVLIKPR